MNMSVEYKNIYPISASLYVKKRSIMEEKIDPNSPDEKFGTEFQTNGLVPYR